MRATIEYPLILLLVTLIVFPCNQKAVSFTKEQTQTSLTESLFFSSKFN